jgi:hypothetical protein
MLFNYSGWIKAVVILYITNALSVCTRRMCVCVRTKLVCRRCGPRRTANSNRQFDQPCREGRLRSYSLTDNLFLMDQSGCVIVALELVVQPSTS